VYSAGETVDVRLCEASVASAKALEAVLSPLACGAAEGRSGCCNSCRAPSPLYAYQAPIAPNVDTNAKGSFGMRMEDCKGADPVLYLLKAEEHCLGFNASREVDRALLPAMSLRIVDRRSRRARAAAERIWINSRLRSFDGVEEVL
jgi:hypothetical protein